MTSIKLFFILQEHVATMNNLAMKLKIGQIDKETAITEAHNEIENLADKLNS